MISIIVPVYNAEKYLDTCIQSILRQTYADFELLLVDDGSTDGSGRICDEYCGRDNRCRTIHQNNGGEFSARNRGLEEAVGEYIAFIDADDYIHPRYLEILYDALLGNRCEIALASVEQVPDSCDRIKVIDETLKCSVISQTELINGLFSFVEFMVVWGKLYKRELLADRRFINKHIALDVEYNSRIYQQVTHAAYVKAKPYYWVCCPTSASRNRFSQRNIDAIDSYVLALGNMPERNQQYRAFGLLRLYKVVLYTRYNAPANFKAAVISKARPIVRQTLSEFVRNRHIPLMHKLSLVAFWYIPPIYKLFRRRIERRARAKTV